MNRLIKPSIAAVILLSMIACTKADKDKTAEGAIGEVQEDMLTASVLKGCHFQNPSVSYSFQTTISPNPIVCAEGVPQKVELLTPDPLPSGLSFSNSQLSLTGTANEKVIDAPYKFYIENESGYAILNLKISIK